MWVTDEILSDAPSMILVHTPGDEDADRGTSPSGTPIKRVYALATDSEPMFDEVR